MLIMNHPDSNMSLALRLVPMPENANLSGNVFGGYVMGQIDLAGTMIASGASSGPVVTVAVDSMQFKQPVYLRDVLNIWGKVTNIGKSSIQLHMEAWVQRMGVPEPIKVTEANLTFVAVDEKGKKREIDAVYKNENEPIAA